MEFRVSTYHVLIVAVAMVVGSARIGIAQDAPFFIGVGSLDGGGYNSVIEGVSADGRVAVGDSGLNAFYLTEAVLWTLADGLRSIVPGRHSDCEGGGVSGTGAVVAGGLVGNRTRWVYRWTAQEGVVELGDLDGGEFRSGANGVSARGDIIVGYGSSDRGGEAFRWTAATGMQGLGHPVEGQVAGSASGISADGRVIVGGARLEGGRVVPFRWTAEDGMENLGLLEDGTYTTTATGVSADGSVVVGYGALDGEWRGYRWTPDEGKVPLEKIHPDQYQQFIYAVSWDGDVIIGNAAVRGMGGNRLIYWTREDGPRWLDDVFAENGVVVPDNWTLSGVTAISADGRTIVGYGSKDLRGQGWVAYLGPTCRADYDEDGAVTQADVWAYIAAWQQRSIFADWDYDGWINTRDLVAFLNEWAAGC